MIKKDIYIGEKEKDDVDYTYREVERPRMHVNDIGPLEKGDNVSIVVKVKGSKIDKAKMDYTVEEPAPSGQQLMLVVTYQIVSMNAPE